MSVSHESSQSSYMDMNDHLLTDIHIHSIITWIIILLSCLRGTQCELKIKILNSIWHYQKDNILFQPPKQIRHLRSAQPWTVQKLNHRCHSMSLAISKFFDKQNQLLFYIDLNCCLCSQITNKSLCHFHRELLLITLSPHHLRTNASNNKKTEIRWDRVWVSQVGFVFLVAICITKFIDWVLSQFAYGFQLAHNVDISFRDLFRKANFLIREKSEKKIKIFKRFYTRINNTFHEWLHLLPLWNLTNLWFIRLKNFDIKNIFIVQEVKGDDLKNEDELT